MTSVLKRIAQRDNRLEKVILTGFIADNGSIASIDNVPPQHPAYAEIDLTKAQNFLIDTRSLRLGEGRSNFLLRIYMTQTKPPLYHQNFEWTMFIDLPRTNDNWIAIQIFNTKAEAESVDNNDIYEFSNETPDGSDIWDGTAAITMQVVNDRFITKSVSPLLYFG
jgi:hypothetical protein